LEVLFDEPFLDLAFQEWFQIPSSLITDMELPHLEIMFGVVTYSAGVCRQADPKDQPELSQEVLYCIVSCG
jgi:hypothetical protein